MKYNKYICTQPGTWTTSQMAQISDKCVNLQADSKKYLQLPLQCPLTVHEQSQEKH
jgi:hypothetical protein